MSGFFQRGYASVKKEQKRQEEAQKRRRGQLFQFFVSENNPEAEIIFLHDEPITFMAHQVQEFVGGGKQRFFTKVCVADEDGEGCPYCEKEIPSSMRGGYLVVDKTPFEIKDKNGKKTKNKGQIKLYIPGLRVLGQLAKKNEKYGLSKYLWEVSRTGTGTSTDYSFDREDKVRLSAREIENMLPEELRKKFNPASNSVPDIRKAIMALLKEQLERLMPDNDEEDDDENEEIMDDDDEIEDDDDEDLENEDDDTEDEEEDEPPRRSKLSAKKTSSKKSGLRFGGSKLRRRK